MHCRSSIHAWPFCLMKGRFFYHLLGIISASSRHGAKLADQRKRCRIFLMLALALAGAMKES